MKWHDNAELKKLFVKPTGENKKIILIKSLWQKIQVLRHTHCGML
jgi:hypothetical protein